MTVQDGVYFADIFKFPLSKENVRTTTQISSTYYKNDNMGNRFIR